MLTNKTQSRRVSTGLNCFDNIIDQFRLGDNVVWQVDSVKDYAHLVSYYIEQAKKDGRNIIYMRFGKHKNVIEDAMPVINMEEDFSKTEQQRKKILEEQQADRQAKKQKESQPEPTVKYPENPPYLLKMYCLNPDRGFEDFATKVHKVIELEGLEAFYVFDCLSELLSAWHSDLMIGNFFKVTCPFLFELDTVAYFALIRNAHSNDTIERIRDTTQVLLDLYQYDGNYFIHPLKVWERHSATMFLPHKLLNADEEVCVRGSAEASELYTNVIEWNRQKLDYWEMMLNRAREAALFGTEEEQEKQKRILVETILCKEKSKMQQLCLKYFTLENILKIASREVGTGYIGGKSVGMLTARKIVMTDARKELLPHWEHHDSYYLGSDIFYTYIVQNGWWKLRVRQKTKEGYYKYAPELKSKLQTGTFPEDIQRQFKAMLEHFGESPIIVRSSSLQEDNFGNAFAGKYDSVFCANQGKPEERYAAFEQAVRTVYASTMNEDALSYRMNRGLWEKDEQMAVLVQRVSGDYYGEYFFPHLAGVGNSSNLYVYDTSIDMSAGMLRLVFGLGTRAVDRVIGDYVKIVTLDNPLREPLVYEEDKMKFSQHDIDLLDIKRNGLASRSFNEVMDQGSIHADKGLFASVDNAAMTRLAALGYRNMPVPFILDFKKLFRTTDFADLMRTMLKTVSKAYSYPVDMEFTVNFKEDGSFKINLLQCRPLQTRGLGKTVSVPMVKEKKDCFFASKGNFMGGNVRLPVDYIIWVDSKAYLLRTEQEKYAVARQIGLLNQVLKGKNALLAGPGRWGTSTASLGVPVTFSELSNMNAICEISCPEGGMSPELSYGSHFFQDLVETGIFYTALFEDRLDALEIVEKDTIPDSFLNPAFVQERKNILCELMPDAGSFQDVIEVVKTEGLELYSDIVSQRVVCTK